MLTFSMREASCLTFVSLSLLWSKYGIYMTNAKSHSLLASTMSYIATCVNNEINVDETPMAVYTSLTPSTLT